MELCKILEEASEGKTWLRIGLELEEAEEGLLKRLLLLGAEDGEGAAEHEYEESSFGDKDEEDVESEARNGCANVRSSAFNS